MCVVEALRLEWPGEEDFGGYIAYASFSKDGGADLEGLEDEKTDRFCLGDNVSKFKMESNLKMAPKGIGFFFRNHHF